YFIKDQLIIKRGGHVDQLSHRYWGMDRFRIYALEKFMGLVIDSKQRKAVFKEISFKYNVLKQGAWKRKKYPYWLNCFINEKKNSLRYAWAGVRKNDK
ncbi:MAG: hypothetical protein WC838_04425, partial [Candidatus Margulisiibacteriota bacterium]